MRRIIAVITAVVACIGWSATSQALVGIKGSAHDLTLVTDEAEICIFCHTPHNAAVAVSPLWNHTQTAVATYELYASPTSTLNATLSQPTGVSKLCLSCHDGTVALDAFGGAAGTPASKLTDPANGLIGTNLKMSHPISFEYDAALITADGELKAAPTGWLNGTKFECSSCHDVHNKVDTGTSMLRVSNADSALCLSCHDK